MADVRGYVLSEATRDRILDTAETVEGQAAPRRRPRAGNAVVRDRQVTVVQVSSRGPVVCGDGAHRFEGRLLTDAGAGFSSVTYGQDVYLVTWRLFGGNVNGSYVGWLRAGDYHLALRTGEAGGRPVFIVLDDGVVLVQASTGMPLVDGRLYHGVRLQFKPQTGVITSVDAANASEQNGIYVQEVNGNPLVGGVVYVGHFAGEWVDGGDLSDIDTKHVYLVEHSPGTTVNGISPTVTITGSGSISVGTSGSTITISYSGSAPVTTVTATSPLASSGGTTPNISLTGTVDAAHGGTGLSSCTTGDLIYASAANTWSKRAIGTQGGILYVDGGVPKWFPPPSADGSLLQWIGGALEWNDPAA